MNDSNAGSSHSSITFQSDELNKPSQSDNLELKPPVICLDSGPPDISKDNLDDDTWSQIIRSGNVKVKRYGNFNWLWRNKWLELREQSLTIRSRKGSTHETIINSQHIATIERTSIKPHCLFLEVKGKKYWLSLASDEELYGWLDDLTHHCHRSIMTAPENFVHHVHVSYDYIAERFQGLPIQWQSMLDESSECFREDDDVEACSVVALQNPRIIGPKFVLRRPPSLYPDPRLDRLRDV